MILSPSSYRAAGRPSARLPRGDTLELRGAAAEDLAAIEQAGRDGQVEALEQRLDHAGHVLHGRRDLGVLEVVAEGANEVRVDVAGDGVLLVALDGRADDAARDLAVDGE